MIAGRWRWGALALLLGVALQGTAAACAKRVDPPPTVARSPAGTPTPCDKCGKERHRPTPTRVRGTRVGQEAPDFSLPDLEGRTVRLSDFRGQVVLLNFWATWCGPCRAEVPGLVAAYERHGERGLKVVAVNVGEPAELVKPFADAYGMSFPVLLDESLRVRRLYPTRGIPSSFLLDGEGTVRQVVLGAMDEEMVLVLVEPLLGG